MPISPGKEDIWQYMINSMNEASLKAEIDKIRKEAGAYERTFPQKTPNGDFVILTFEDENPTESFAKVMGATQGEFVEFVLEVHGLDMKGPPLPLPQLVCDRRA